MMQNDRTVLQNYNDISAIIRTDFSLSSLNPAPLCKAFQVIFSASQVPFKVQCFTETQKGLMISASKQRTNYSYSNILWHH